MDSADLKGLRLELSTAATTSELVFSQLVKRAMALLDLADADLSYKLDVSWTTIKRWRMGTGAPVPAIRPMVYSILMDMIDGRVGVDNGE